MSAPLRRRPALLALSLLVAVPAWLAGRPQFASSVDLVEVYATVTDASGAPVTGLTSADFEVREDGHVQAVQAFAAGDFPLSVALAIDHSASMAGARLRLAAAAARGFLGRLRPDDQSMVIGISSEVEVLAPLSTDRAAQGRALDALKPWSTTSLNDAIIAGINLVQPGRGRRGLIVLSDGEDRYSAARPEDVLSRARRSDVLLYPVALGRQLPALFPRIAVLTGGRSLHVQDPKRLDAALADIARELRHQYLLGYSPAPAAGGASAEPAWHGIEVRVRRADLRVRARDGYFGR